MTEAAFAVAHGGDAKKNASQHPLTSVAVCRKIGLLRSATALHPFTVTSRGRNDTYIWQPATHASPFGSPQRYAPSNRLSSARSNGSNSASGMLACREFDSAA